MFEPYEVTRPQNRQLILDLFALEEESLLQIILSRDPLGRPAVQITRLLSALEIQQMQLITTQPSEKPN